MLVPRHRDPPLVAVEALGRDDLGAGRGDVGLLAAVARRPLAAGDVDPPALAVEVRDGDDAGPAGERADGRAVDERLLREERRERPRLAVADAAERARVVALDPAVEAPVAHLVADQAHQPLAGRRAHDPGLAELGAQVDRDQVGAVGGVVEVVVDAQERCRPAAGGSRCTRRGARPRSTRPPGGFTCTEKRSCGPYQISSSFSETSHDPVADDDPLDVVHELARRRSGRRSGRGRRSSRCRPRSRPAPGRRSRPRRRRSGPAARATRRSSG